MPITVVIGGQFGSEGKGKVTHFWAKHLKAKITVRIGGPNAGHMAYNDEGEKFVLQQLPTPFIIPETINVLAAGNYIKLSHLFAEIEKTKISTNRLLIDPKAVIITDQVETAEKNTDLRENIVSTLSGTGAAVIARLSRIKDVPFAGDCEALQPYLADTAAYMRSELNKGERIIIEGTQGFGLSLLHSGLYPFCTSRDTSAIAFVSEAGLSPLDVDQIVMILRSYQLRVAGNSGPLFGELTWNQLTQMSGSRTPLLEHTSVTKKIRRVGTFDADLVNRCIQMNRPTHIVLNHTDYFDSVGCETGKISAKTKKALKNIEKQINRKIDYAGIDGLGLILFNKANDLTKTHKRPKAKTAAFNKNLNKISSDFLF